MGLPWVSVSELLGSEVSQGRRRYPIGALWHLYNGSVVFPLLHAGLFSSLSLPSDRVAHTWGVQRGSPLGVPTAISEVIGRGRA